MNEAVHLFPIYAFMVRTGTILYFHCCFIFVAAAATTTTTTTTTAAAAVLVAVVPVPFIAAHILEKQVFYVLRRTSLH
jgi:hypothetical protein